jgi:starvation-inducible DNA-binding protein
MNVDIGLSSEALEQSKEVLQELLSDTFVVYFKTHIYHWNIEGPHFVSLHQLFEEQYSELWKALDAIAERIRTLGYSAPKSPTQLLSFSTLSSESAAKSDQDIILDLLDTNQTLIKNIRNNLEKLQEHNDEASIDLLVERLDVHEKTAWMLRVTLQSHG